MTIRGLEASAVACQVFLVFLDCVDCVDCVDGWGVAGVACEAALVYPH